MCTSAINTARQSQTTAQHEFDSAFNAMRWPGKELKELRLNFEIDKKRYSEAREKSLAELEVMKLYREAGTSLVEMGTKYGSRAETATSDDERQGRTTVRAASKAGPVFTQDVLEEVLGNLRVYYH